jgi:hypothetical protein
MSFRYLHSTQRACGEAGFSRKLRDASGSKESPFDRHSSDAHAVEKASSNDCDVLPRIALWLDAAYAPPWWVHLVTTLPLLIVLCALPLRPLKGWFVYSQYLYKAEEGQLAVPNTSSDIDAGRSDRATPSRQERLSSSTPEGDGVPNHRESAVSASHGDSK